uniref:NADH-ubiquinone oxidoreductase chain 4L n=1 Tax=Cyanea nozakii TaxID=135523 RepID=A0A343VTM2_CYANO|nr:NADH dehydrogenase subunit 4L [Cyanea nozakii]
MGIKFFVITSILTSIIGIIGISLNRSNLIILLMSLELLLLGASFLILIGASYHNLLFGQLFSIIILTIAAAESAIGLAIMVSYFRIRGKISIKSLNVLRG